MDCINDFSSKYLLSGGSVTLAGAVLIVLGVISAARVALCILSHVMGMLSSAPNVSKFGKWAVVTGATDGIGLAYSKRFAKMGMNIALLSRTKSKLDDVAATLEKDYSVETLVVPADFSKKDDKMYKDIERALGGLDIGVLVNNVGMSYPTAMYFDEISRHEPTLMDNMVNLNIVSALNMTRIVVPGMIAKKKGCIINVASGAGRIPIGNPMYAVYSGSKAFIDYFGRSLHHELKSKGILVQSQSPYLVVSKLSKIRKPSLRIPSPDVYVKCSLAALGQGEVSVPFFWHRVEDWFLHNLPRFVVSRVLLSMHTAIRKKYFKKRDMDMTR